MPGIIFFTPRKVLDYLQYKSLQQNEQVDLLLGDGVYLDLNRYTSSSYIELYALEDFYVEVYFERTTEEPMFLRPFTDLRQLDPYLAGISVEQLFQLR
jgi:hypothetical protein